MKPIFFPPFGRTVPYGMAMLLDLAADETAEDMSKRQ